MKDLKHLIWFEKLLEEANNALIGQAREEGKVCVAYICENTPEPLMNLPGTFGIRLTAPHTGSMDIATYYMTSFLCEASRALLERAVEGGFNFADCLIAPDGCTMINRAAENIELLHAMDEGKDRFFYEHMELPLKADDNGVALLKLDQFLAAGCLPCFVRLGARGRFHIRLLKVRDLAVCAFVVRQALVFLYPIQKIIHRFFLLNSCVSVGKEQSPRQGKYPL